MSPLLLLVPLGLGLAVVATNREAEALAYRKSTTVDRFFFTVDGEENEQRLLRVLEGHGRIIHMNTDGKNVTVVWTGTQIDKNNMFHILGVMDHLLYGNTPEQTTIRLVKVEEGVL